MNSSIKDFYADKTIFLTGGAGYIGSLTLAKLLKLNVVKEILILLRPKRGKSNQQRLDEMFRGFSFAGIEQFDANYKSKVKIIDGDVEMESIGISSGDREYLKEHVNIVIHGAAILNFEGALKQTIAINVRGTKQMLDLGTELKNLESFVFVSTAYSQCPRVDSRETFYESPIDYQKIIQIAEEMTDDDLNSLTKTLIAPWPNTYVFSKAVTEDMIRQYQYRLPIAIARPSIVMSTYADPVPGFSNTLLGTLGFCFAIMLGLFNVTQLSKDTAITNIPADITVNSILAITAKNVEWKEKAPKIFNVVGNNERVTLERFFKLMEKYARVFPTLKASRLPKAPIRIKSTVLYRIGFFVGTVIPAALMEMIFNVFGSKRMKLMKSTREVYCFLAVLKCLDKTLLFDNRNMRKISEMMTKDDVSRFPCTVKPNDFENFAANTVEGIRTFYLRENNKDMEKAAKRIKIFLHVDRLFHIGFYCLLLYIVFAYVKDVINNN